MHFKIKNIMETMTIEYDSQNKATMQILTGLMAMGVFHKREENDFESGLKRAISGDELMNRMTNRINKMFENERAIPA